MVARGDPAQQSKEREQRARTRHKVMEQHEKRTANPKARGRSATPKRASTHTPTESENDVDHAVNQASKSRESSRPSQVKGGSGGKPPQGGSVKSMPRRLRN